MTMPKRSKRSLGRRSVTIDDIEYHYVIPGDGQNAVATIQRAKGSAGSFLFVAFGGDILTPSRIVSAIRYGISCGWEPSRSSDPICLNLEVNGEGVSRFKRDLELEKAKIAKIV